MHTAQQCAVWQQLGAHAVAALTNTQQGWTGAANKAPPTTRTEATCHAEQPCLLRAKEPVAQLDSLPNPGIKAKVCSQAAMLHALRGLRLVVSAARRGW